MYKVGQKFKHADSGSVYTISGNIPPDADRVRCFLIEDDTCRVYGNRLFVKDPENISLSELEEITDGCSQYFLPFHPEPETIAHLRDLKSADNSVAVGDVPLFKDDADIEAFRKVNQGHEFVEWGGKRPDLDPLRAGNKVKGLVTDILAEGRKDDDGKLRWELLPMGEVEKIVEVLTYGAKKYAPDNWQNVVGGKDRYYGALMRHLVAWRKGEKLDPESGLSHLSHVACNALFLLHFDEE